MSRQLNKAVLKVFVIITASVQRVSVPLQRCV